MRALLVGLVAMVALPASAQVTINRWQDLQPYIAEQTEAINAHGATIREQAAQIEAHKATINAQRAYIADLTCKWNGLVKALAAGQPITYQGDDGSQHLACGNQSPAPQLPPPLQ